MNLQTLANSCSGDHFDHQLPSRQILGQPVGTFSEKVSDRETYPLRFLHTGQPLVQHTRTKLGEEHVVSYDLPEASAQIFSGQKRANLRAFFTALDDVMRLAVSKHKSGVREQSFYLTEKMPKSFWGTIVNELLKAREELGFHKVSGARYSALGVFGGLEYVDQYNIISNKDFHFVSSSNIDPPFQHFQDLNHRRCAENSLIKLANINGLQKLRYLFLMRGPNPEGYGNEKSERGFFDFSKLVPCTGCLPHLERLYRDGGNLILVTTTQRALELEKKINLAEKKLHELLKNLKHGDINILYPSGRANLDGYAFIEIPNKKLPRIITEASVGTNVASGGTQNQRNRHVLTFERWLRRQERAIVGHRKKETSPKVNLPDKKYRKNNIVQSEK